MMHDEAAGYSPPPRLGQILAGLVELIWKIEHAFERARLRNRPVDSTRLRIFGVLTLFAFGFAFLAFRAGVAALVHPQEGGLAGVIEPALQRADLVDRNGAPVALDVPHYGVYIDSREIWDVKEARRGLLEALPGLARDRLDQVLTSGKRELLLNGLDEEARDRVHDLGLPGVGFEEEPRRSYPLGADAAHLVGFADPQGKGLAGAEKAFDTPVRDAAAGGGVLTLSMDLRVQGALVSELRNAMSVYGPRAAVGLVTNVNTGEVLALASLPDFDPNRVADADPAALTNHAGASVYEVGSTFKTFTFAMALDSHTASMASYYDATHPLNLGGRIIHDHDPKNRPLSFEEIYLYSSNIGASRIALQAGADRMKSYLKNFGLFEPAKIELAESARPLAPRDWTDNVLASVSFGQNISVTPLALAQAYGAVANGGQLIPLTIRKRTQGDAVETHRVISSETSQAMLALLRKNVLSGTGSKADMAGLRVGGKTGSAQKADHGHYLDNTRITNFAAVFPTDGPVGSPRYLVLILLDEPKAAPGTFGLATAGWNAAPTAGRVIDRIAPFLDVKRVKSAVTATAAEAPAIEEDAPQ